MRVKKTDLETLSQVHSRIPEFDEGYIRESYEEKAEGSDPCHLVAVDGEQKVGYTLCYDKFGDGSYYVWMAGVIPEKRRNGVMTRIVEKAEEIADEKGYESVKIKTRNERKEMRHFLIENGYEVCGYNEKDTVGRSEILHEKKF